MSKLGKWYGIPMAIALLIALVAGGFGAFLGVLILLGGIGLLLVVGVIGYNKQKASNPEIRLVDGKLVMGKVEVTIADIERWTTHKVRRTSDVPGPDAVAVFRVPIFRDGERGVRPDGGPAFETITFGWQEMTPAEIDGVRDALVPHVSALWVPIDRLRD